ncbi:YqgQ family protein [Kurthia senegalensis]|uniref:YqgQ family protein n=1 Tax=Kurthia senegalensis TaxID=1033740 RepID=UPI000289AF24|nr:YqgQ family protein [Kurthia senegalensis]
MAKRVTDVGQIETIADVQQYLKRFGTFIYTKNRIGDLHLMEADMRALYEAGILDVREYQKSRHILISEEVRLQKEGYTK